MLEVRKRDDDTRYRPVTRANVEDTPQWGSLSAATREAVDVVSRVLPFRVNRYVMDELIDWDRVPDDPIFQLTFPQRGMLEEEDYETIADLIARRAPRDEFDAAVHAIRTSLNPHPAGQMTHNAAMLDEESLPGVQHKYRETVLFFPSHGQTCHAYCTFCFRWAQFIGVDDLKFASREIDQLRRYLLSKPDVTDVLFTGGDPMIMKTSALRAYLEPLLAPEFDHVRTIRIGTKSVGYWPQRFVSDRDADDLLRLFEQVAAAGKQLALMGHYSHPVEFEPKVAREAVRRIRSAGANIRMQSPVIRHVNDHSDIWVDLWRTGTQLGCIPYYMFVERDTGARSYFEVPLARTWRIFRNAYQQVSGVARTVRGPSMSAFPGKVHVLGVTEMGDQKVFVLEYLQCRDPELVRRPFFAKFDASAVWYDQLRPATERDYPFFIDDLEEPAEESPTAIVHLTIGRTLGLNRG
jgi:KamA family protein